ncbi:MAG: response regulator [Burkholderiales bacterium]|nr:response regulator [Burkholderiales bacterium]
MRIRAQLVLLVLAVIAPIALLAALATLGLWELQRESYHKRFQERVSALRIALDTELDATVRQLRALSEALDPGDGSSAASFGTHAERLLRHYPSWCLVGLLGSDGASLARAERRPALARAQLDDALIARIRAQPEANVSDLSDVADTAGVYVTYVAVPVIREGQLRGILYIGIEGTSWLEFFRRHPLHERATLTLNDRQGRIIARTLENERWAGKSSSPQFWDSTRGRNERTLVNVGVDGRRYYSAFSRSQVASWLVSTGVPESDLDAALDRPIIMITSGVIAAAVAATLFALLLGGRISTALTGLAGLVASLTSGQRAEPQRQLAIEEAETVRRALVASSELLAKREAALTDALAREASSRASAERASRAKDDLLAMLGHELRNPISAMQAAVSVLEMPAAKPDVAQRARQVIQRQIGHLATIINDLLDVARLDSGKLQLQRERIDLAQVVRHVIEAFCESGRCAKRTIDAALAPVRVIGDETRLEQVVSNLLDNACKYTPEGGRIALSLREQDDSVVFSVTDSGSGIAPELLPRIFDLFAQGQRTLDRAQGGLGLGLTVVRQLVELHGGSISAASEGPDLGASFVVKLPLARDDTAPKTERATPAALRALRIALVEDNADSRNFVAEVLRMRGHGVIEADSGVGGVQLIAAGDVEVALVDIGLPGLDGYEVAQRVRASPAGATVRLIALTGYGREEDKAKAIAAGFDMFLIKPFDMARFEAAVAELEAHAAFQSASHVHTRV